MRRALLVTLLLALAVPSAAHGQVTEGGEVVERDAGALCRTAGGPCQPEASEAAVAAFEGSWVDRALAFQRALGDGLPLRDAPWIGTHNSFNSIAEMGPALSTTDSNQQLTLRDQLRIGVRSLELDVHWWLERPVVCHAQGDHSGCSVEGELGSALDPVAAWLREHPDEVLLLYVEDHLDGHGAVADALLRERFGALLYEPPAGGCTALPLSLTRDAIRAAGARVVAVSGGCGLATAFDWSRSHEESRPVGFEDFPGCGPDYTRAQYDGTLIRYYEDSTWLTASVGSPDEGITPATAAAMARCGVDLIGLDQVVPGDGRLEALVWSWAEGEQDAAGCAAQGGDGRWLRRPCDERRPAACRTGATWSLSKPVRHRDAAKACGRGAAFAPPRTGYENARLREAAGAASVWLGVSA